MSGSAAKARLPRRSRRWGLKDVGRPARRVRPPESSGPCEAPPTKLCTADGAGRPGGSSPTATITSAGTGPPGEAHRATRPASTSPSATDASTALSSRRTLDVGDRPRRVRGCCRSPVTETGARQRPVNSDTFVEAQSASCRPVRWLGLDHGLEWPLATFQACHARHRETWPSLRPPPRGVVGDAVERNLDDGPGHRRRGTLRTAMPRQKPERTDSRPPAPPRCRRHGPRRAPPTRRRARTHRSRQVVGIEGPRRAHDRFSSTAVWTSSMDQPVPSSGGTASSTACGARASGRSKRYASEADSTGCRWSRRRPGRASSPATVDDDDGRWPAAACRSAAWRGASPNVDPDGRRRPIRREARYRVVPGDARSTHALRRARTRRPRSTRRGAA